jgi:hypothetical protein
MSDGKIEENGEQGQLGEIKAMVESIKEKVDKIEGGVNGIKDKMRRERWIQVGLPLMVFVLSTLLVFLSVTLTSGEGERVYGERWSGYIFTFFVVVELGFVALWLRLLLPFNQKNGDSTKGKQPKPKPR